MHEEISPNPNPDDNGDVIEDYEESDALPDFPEKKKRKGLPRKEAHKTIIIMLSIAVISFLISEAIRRNNSLDNCTWVVGAIHRLSDDTIIYDRADLDREQDAGILLTYLRRTEWVALDFVENDGKAGETNWRIPDELRDEDWSEATVDYCWQNDEERPEGAEPGTSSK